MGFSMYSDVQPMHRVDQTMSLEVQAIYLQPGTAASLEKNALMSIKNVSAKCQVWKKHLMSMKNVSGPRDRGPDFQDFEKKPGCFLRSLCISLLKSGFL